jgi:hypothetical protein
MTRQQVYNQVVEGFIAQKRMAMSPGNAACYYREPETKAKCAIGMLIPDELYNSEIEFHSIADLLEGCTGFKHIDAVGKHLRSILDDGDRWDNEQFLSQLQESHDLASDQHELFYNLKELAIRFHLDYLILMDNEHEFDNWPSE